MNCCKFYLLVLFGVFICTHNWSCKPDSHSSKVNGLKNELDTINIFRRGVASNWNDSIVTIGKIQNIRLHTSDSILQFYLNGEIVSERIRANSSYLDFASIDIDFDHEPELVSSSFFNMNGMTFCEVFDWDSSGSDIVRKGELFGGFIIDYHKQTLNDRYVGSWYHAVIARELCWAGDTLTLKRKLTKMLVNQEPDSNNELIYNMTLESRNSCHSKLDTVWHQPYDSTKYHETLNSFKGWY